MRMELEIQGQGNNDIQSLRDADYKEFKLGRRVLKMKDEFTSAHIKAGRIILKAFRNLIKIKREANKEKVDKEEEVKDLEDSEFTVSNDSYSFSGK